jgi:hypothetical protein
MPPLAKSRVDKAGLGLIAEWIAGLEEEADDPLPDGWSLQAIGNHVTPPVGTWRKGSFFLTAQCHDLWETSDDAVLAHASPMDSGQISARVVSLTPADAWTKAGVMVRESTAPDSPHAIMVVTPGQGSAFQYRESAGQFTQHLPGPAVTAPFWVRLAWKDGTVVASTSPDGRSWTETGRTRLASKGPVLAGLCLSAHQTGATATAAYDQVRIAP